MRQEEIVKYIMCAQPEEIQEILDAVTIRYSEVFPEWHLNIFVLPMGDRVKRREQLNRLLQMAEMYGNL